MPQSSPQDHDSSRSAAAVAARAVPQGMVPDHSGNAGTTTAGLLAMPQSPRRGAAAVPRGITATVSTTTLRERIRLRALETVNRFRVLRTLDVAVACFPERGFKASLSAAQRAVRAMVKERLIRRYRTDRFQTIYGLTVAGANWLEERGVDAAPSVRRVADMLNPEHQLWAQFLGLSCEARGLQAASENELLQELAQKCAAGGKPVRGLLTVRVDPGGETRHLRPDLIATDRDGSCVWFEVDRSKRGSAREASLRALVLAMGSRPANGQLLRRIVIFARDRRVQLRALAVLEALVAAQQGRPLIPGHRQVRPAAGAGQFEVWERVPVSNRSGVTEYADRVVGRVQVQLLPSWLPKVRMDASHRDNTAGWLGGNYLPFARFAGERPWGVLRSPLL